MARVLLFTLLLFLTGGNAIAQIEIMKDFDLGDFNVGFKYEKIFDSTRTYDDCFRPIQLFIWYPSHEISEDPINYTEYVYLNDLKSEPWKTKPERKEELLNKLLKTEIENSTITEELESILPKYQRLKTIAHKESAIVDKSFPLILFAPGGSTPGYLHSVMCEYLASHGYIVVSFPTISNSDSLRWPFDQTGLDLHIDDMEFAINHLSNSLEQVNIDKIGLISWSVGGVSQGLLCMKNQEIDVLISLDSGLGREYGVTNQCNK